jgi:hypothetical protein
VGDAGHQGVDVALRPVDAGDLPGHPVVGQRAVAAAGDGARQQLEDLAQQPRVRIGHHLAEVGDLADLPQQPQALRVARAIDHLVIVREGGQGHLVVGLASAVQPGHVRPPLEALEQQGRAAEIELDAAPVGGADGIEAVALDRLDQLGIERSGLGGGAEAAVAHVAAGAPRDLGDLRGVQAPAVAAVELVEPGEGDMVEVHVEAHADGVGRHHVVDLAALVERHLGVAGARAERAHHHRGAAALATHQLGQGIDLGGGEGHDRRARRQPGDLLLAGVGEGGEARAAEILRLRHQAAHERPDGVGT